MAVSDLTDAGVLLAAANQDEDEHEACVSLLEKAAGGLLVSPLVVAEVCYMLGTPTARSCSPS